jgi:cell wall-associated NlpC family hydrolase
MEPWEYAMQYLGVPFLHMGRTPQGLDCVGLLVLVARDCGWEPIDQDFYSREPSKRSGIDKLADYLRINLGEPVTRPMQPNDIMLMRLRRTALSSHVAMVAPHPEGLGMIHTYGEIKRVTYHRIDAYRTNQMVEVFEWPAKS